MFGWSPDQFWAATPAELSALVEALGVRVVCGDGGEAPPDADTIARLREAFPDG